VTFLLQKGPYGGRPPGQHPAGEATLKRQWMEISGTSPNMTVYVKSSSHDTPQKCHSRTLPFNVILGEGRGSLRTKHPMVGDLQDKPEGDVKIMKPEGGWRAAGGNTRRVRQHLSGSGWRCPEQVRT